MSIQRLFPVALAVLTATACAEVSDPVSSEPQLSMNGAGHRVVGSGHVQAGDGIREFTFHAMEDPSGEVSGSYKIVLPNGLFVEADVTCLTVDGDTGWVGGVIRDSNAGIIDIGSTTMFYAIDDGEGDGAADIVSLAAFNQDPGVDLQFCNEQPLELAPLAVAEGNVQVR